MRYAFSLVADALTILLLDDRPESLHALTEFLVARRHSVLTVTSGKEALQVISKRRDTHPIDLLITELSVPGMEGMAMLRELQRRQERCQVAILTGYAQLHPHVQEHAASLGCLAVLEKPADLRQVDQLLLRVSWERSTNPPPERKDEDKPFFGTSRVVRAEDVKTARVHRPGGTVDQTSHRTPLPFDEADAQAEPARAMQPSSTGITRPPTTAPASSSRSPSEATNRPGTGERSRSGSAAIQRPATAPVARPAIPIAPEAVALPAAGQAPAAERPIAPVTTRLRRSITGTERIVRPPSATSATGGTRAVACASCNRAFRVEDRPSGYSVLCVYCGQLNRIEPLGPTGPPGT